jgi:hypothetical protein
MTEISAEKRLDSWCPSLVSGTFLELNKKKIAKQLLTVSFCFSSTFAHEYPQNPFCLTKSQLLSALI